MIDNITQLESFFPYINKRLPNEWHSPCPMCNGDGVCSEKGGVRFYGEDRLIWFLANNVFVCRQCKERGDGRSGKGLYTLQMMANLFGVAVSGELTQAQTRREEIPLSNLWADFMVERAHREVKREWFYGYGWTDETINRFKLGWGRFRGHAEPVHIIPMKIRRVIADSPEDELVETTDWYVATRGADRPLRSSGSVFNYWCEIVNNPESKIVMLAEGEKDGISLAQVFPDHNVVISWGAASWMEQKTRLLAEKYEECWVFGDNDDAGQAFSSQVQMQAMRLGMRCRVHLWDMYTGLPKGFDVTDLLARERGQTADLLLANLSISSDITPVDPQVEAFSTTLDILRSPDHPDSLMQRVKTYLAKADNSLFVLAAPPGAGKSYTLSQIAQEMASQLMPARIAERLVLEQRIADVKTILSRMPESIEKQNLIDVLTLLEQELNEFSYASIAWYGQYRDGYQDLLANGMNPDLCFNYEARTAENCQNYQLVNVLGANNHDIGMFCATGCPYRAQCEASGYLSQDRKRKEKPITFFRHEHILSSFAQDYKELAIVDENPCHIYDNKPLLVKADDVLPHSQNWGSAVQDSESVKNITLLVSALRVALGFNSGAKQYLDDRNPNPNYMVSGVTFLSLLDTCIRSLDESKNLLDVLENIDEALLDSEYHPTYDPQSDTPIKKRCMREVYKALLQEAPAWVESPANRYPTRIHLVAGCLELYLEPSIRIRKKSPLIVADATAMPQLYGAMFKRPYDGYAPLLQNPNAKITVIKGSDYTKGQLKDQLGSVIAARKKEKTAIYNILGEVVDIDAAIPHDVTRYNSTIMHEANLVIKELAIRHEKLLVITHKDLRQIIEDVVRLPNVDYAHYGSLRGSNRFADYEAALLVGAYRVPYDIMWRKIQSWAAMIGIRDPIPYETHTLDSQFPNTTIPTQLRSFLHPFAASFVDMVEAGELIQSSERIRPHSTSSPKYVYVMANRPALRYTTEVIQKSVFLQMLDPSSKSSNLLNYVLAELERNFEARGIIKPPTYSTLVREFHVSNRDVSRIVKTAIERFEGRLRHEGIERLPTAGS